MAERQAWSVERSDLIANLTEETTKIDDLRSELQQAQNLSSAGSGTTELWNRVQHASQVDRALMDEVRKRTMLLHSTKLLGGNVKRLFLASPKLAGSL